MRTYQINLSNDEDDDEGWETVPAPADDDIAAWVAAQEAACEDTGVDRVRVLDETGTIIEFRAFFD